MMLDTMMHEPFYESGRLCAPEIGVWAGWVAHQQSFAARQSRATTDDVGIALAGECYEDGPGSAAGRQLQTVSRFRQELNDRPAEQWISGLNGLFSGVLVDRRRSRAHLFNDRYGLERIYIHETNQAVYFASEAKALLRVLPALRSFDDQGVAEFFAFGCPLHGRTLFRGITILEGASLWTSNGRTRQKARYFTPLEWERQSELKAEDFQSELEFLFKRALARYVADDSRLGISLTGGLDTRMIMACLPPLATPPVCYTFIGLDGRTLDARVATRVASECGFEHHLLRIERDFLADYGSHVDRTVYVTDGSAGPLWTHELYLNARARRLSQVRLTGNFGSEVLRSVSTLKQLGLSQDVLAPDFRHQVDGVARNRTDRSESSVTFAAFREIPWNLFGIVASAKSQLTFRTPYLDNDLVALAYRAPKHVRQSATSATDLVRNAHARLGAIPTDRAVVSNGAGPAYALKRAFAEVTFKLDYLHQEAPPKGLMRLLAAFEKTGLLGLHKWLPYRLWFQNELAAYVGDALTDRTTSQLPYVNHDALEQMVDDHVGGRKNFVREINAVITLARIDRLLLRGGGWSRN